MKTMPVGKYAGTPVKELPTNYLAHAIENFTIEPTLKKELKKELIARLNLFPVYSLHKQLSDGNIENAKSIVKEFLID